MYSIITTRRFERRIERFRRRHPELQERLERVLGDLIHDPQQPQLRLHALSGRLEGFHAVSVTYEQRIVLILRVSEREIELIDIGSHDDVYR